jgi:hypothetical protein
MRSGIINRQSFLELSLLAIFAAGLFVANLIVDSRSRILLSPGIPLAGSGLTVYLPAQHGWQGLTEWQYEQNNCFVLPARLVGQSGPAMDIYWKYNLSTAAQSSREALAELAVQAGGKLQDVEQTTGDCPMECGRLITPRDRNDRYIGVALLDFGRALILQVQSGEDLFSARDVFLALADSVHYEKSAELARGVELLENARRFEVEKIFSDRQEQNFLIWDAAHGIRGYATIRMSVDSRGQLRIDETKVFNAAAIRRKNYIFESSNPFEVFCWQCQNSGVSGPGGLFRIELNKQGILTLEDESSGQTRTCRSGSAMVGEILLDAMVRFFLETEQQKTVVDILYAEGLIIPAEIFSIPLERAQAKTEGMAFAVRMESLDGSATEFYFDADKKSLGKLTVEAHRGILLWEPAERKEIEKYFDTRPVRKGPVAKKM